MHDVCDVFVIYEDSVLIFTSFSGCWSPVFVTGSKPCPRQGHTLTAVDEKNAILFGGFDGEKLFNDMWLFDGERKVVSCCFVLCILCDFVCV